MEESRIKAGDIVKLKSGGPRMTAGSMVDNHNINCSWFDEGDVFHREFFHLLALVKLSQ